MRNLILGISLAAVALSVCAADAMERKFIRAGMDEGEVLVKIGKPDYESVVTGNNATTIEKKWTYVPTPRDVQTMTLITIKDGKVVNIERKISR